MMKPVVSAQAVATTLAFLWRHPLARQHRLKTFGRWLGWQLGSRLVPGSVAVPFVDDTRLLMRTGMTGATGNLYAGLAEFEDMGFALHLLRPGDVFVDVGANIGAYSILASGACGARTIAFEPVASTFRVLLDNIELNHLSSLVDARNQGVGAQATTLKFTTGQDTINHVAGATEAGTIVPVTTLDTALADVEPLFMKVDTEGYESFVLDGATRTFSSKPPLAVLLELGGAGSRYGRDENDLREKMRAWGYEMVRYDPLKRQLTRLAEAPNGNTLLVRDLTEVAERIARSARHDIAGTLL